MPIQEKNYDAGYKRNKKPLLIACSGGGGHISAIQGVRDFLDKKYHRTIKFPKYPTILHDEKQSSSARTQIDVGSVATNSFYILSPIIKTILSFTNLPLLPSSGDLKDEIDALNKKETTTREREYVDMLLDVYPAGYESAAIWNVLQRKDQTTELKKLIELQSGNDQENYEYVCRDILKLLKTAAANNISYTEIISTQAMGLPALCDTVKKYNTDNPDKPKIVIHQYMTDLPTKGAVHFFKTLSTLTHEQQQQIKLYGVGMKQDILDHFFPTGDHFNGVYDIPAKNNPMVRAGFKDSTHDNSKRFNVDVTISLKGEDPIKIIKHEQIASIMLGSQASDDTVEYIETLIKNGMDKVFVFGGKNDAISKKIDAILAKNPTYNDRVIRLGNQDDVQIAQLMTRSNMVIIRGGGLSVMEQMTMPHNKRQTILIHHANSHATELTSGISWEDDNVTALMADLKLKQVHAEKTSPERAKRQIAEARLIAVAKRSKKWSIDESTRYIKALPKKQLEQIVASLQNNSGKNTRPLFKYLSAKKLNEVEKQQELEAKIQLVINTLITDCDGCKLYLNNVIAGEVSTLSKLPFDIEQVIKNSADDEFKQASPAFFSAIDSYKAVVRLLATLNDESNIPPSEKLLNFKNEYEKPETRDALLYSNDNFIIRFIREINYQLSKIFIFNCMGLDRFFTPAQKIRREMEITKPEQINPTTPSPGS